MLSDALFFFERVSAYLQGKGGTNGTNPREFPRALALLKSNDVKLCVDIGGNKGIYTDEIVRRFPSCKVIVFEPANVNVELLRNKFSGNTNVRIEASAVSNISGTADLFSNEEGSELASLTKRNLDHLGINFDTKEKINTIVFEEYWREQLGSEHIDICKIDIEGHELDALSGFGEALRHIDVIQFEFGGCNIDTRTYFQDFWYFYKQNGFQLFRMTPFGIVPIKRYHERDESFAFTTNYLARRIN